MKTIEQLLQLKNNPYYRFTIEEQKILNDFLSKNSEQQKSPKNNLNNLDNKNPVTVHAKNIVHTDNGIVPTEEQVARAVHTNS